jgi:cytoskeletal protein CcmA (bactofilin family)
MIILPLLTILVFGSVHTVQAAVINRDGNVGANEIIDDDIFMSAQKINMDGTINGNMLGVGETVVVNGTVNGDVFLTGQNLVVTDKAKISGNLFVGGQFVDIRGKISGSVFGGATAFSLKQGAEVAGNLYYGGFHFSTEPETRISRDVFVGSYQSILNGAVARNINISAAAIELNGTVGKNANLSVASSGSNDSTTWEQFMPNGTPPAIKPGLRISKDAKINGQLTYTSRLEQSSGIAAQPQGGIVYQTPVPGKNEQSRSSNPSAGANIILNLGNTVFDILRDFFTLMVLGGLVLWLKPVWMNKAQKLALLKPVFSAGYGLSVITIGYLAAGLAAILILVLGILLSIVTLGGLSNTVFGVGFSSLSFMLAIFTLVISYGSKLVITCLIGGMIIHKLAPGATHPEIWGLAVGVFLFVIVQPIPVFGFLINVLVTIMGMGAIWLLFTNQKMAALTEEEVPAV